MLKRTAKSTPLLCTRRVRLERIALLAALIAVAACSASPQSAAARWPAHCLIGDGPAPDTLRMALPMAADALAAVSLSDAAERIAFGHVYETLVRLDCDGRVVPAIAQSWTETDHGLVRTFRLRPDARFADGSPLDAADVVAIWSEAAARGDGAAAGIEWVAASGERAVRVGMRAMADVALFASRDLVVAQQTADARPPLGTGRFRLVSAGVPLILERHAGAGAPHRIEVHAAGEDPRVMLDAGVDLLVTAEPAALAYAAELAGYDVAPLAWSRTYVLATAAVHEPGPVPRDALHALAVEAGVDGTRPAALPRWWQTAACRAEDSPSGPGLRPALPAARVVYLRDDVHARAIAERIAALAWPPARAPGWLTERLPARAGESGAPIAVGLDEPALVDALRSGRFMAAVHALPRSIAGAAPGGDPCIEAPAGNRPARALLASPLDLTPLLDARLHVVHRRGSGRFIVEGDGGLLLENAVP